MDFFSSTVRQDAQQASDSSFSPFVSPLCVGRDSSVGITTRYGLDAPGIEYQWWTRFSAHVLTVDSRSFPGIRRPEHGLDNPPHLVLSVKKE